MKFVASEKNFSSVIPYERYGSRRTHRATSSPSSADAGPLDGSTRCSSTNIL